MRLIDADALKTAMDECIYSDRDRFSTGYAKSFIDDAPTVDAVPVVRCRDCKHGEYDDAIEDAYCYHCRYDGYTYNKADHFCSDGERKGGGE